MSNLIIAKYVSTRSYKLTHNSISFIENAINNINYVLYGNFSDLWTKIVETQNYNEVKKYAISQNTESILDDFLYCLKTKGLINSDITFQKSKCNYLNFEINGKSKNFELFTKKKSQILNSINVLEHLSINLNYNCNLKCKHCCNFKDIKEEISFNSAKQIIDEAYNLGVFSVLLTGGECTINKDFLKIAEYIRKKHLMLTVLTNGQKLYDDEELFENFVSLYPSNVQISLYSMDAKIHDNLTTVKGSHYKTLNVIKKLKSRNINTNVSCFQTSYNPKSYIEVKKFTEELGVNFNTNCLFYYNPMNKNLNAKLKIKEIKDFYINTIDINNPRETEFACSGGMDRISVLPNLDVTPCNYCYYILGNYKKNSLENIRNTNVKVFQNTFKKENLKDCYKHSYCKYCINCARYHSYTQNGLLKKCNQLCIDAKMYEEALKFVRGIEG